MAVYKQSVDYYSVYVGKHAERRLKYIRRDYGCAGVDVWRAVLDMIYSGEGYYLQYDDTNRADVLWDISEMVRGKDSPNDSDIEQMIATFVDMDLLDKGMFDMGILTSEDIQEQYYMSTLKRRATKVDTRYWMLSMDRMQSLSDRSPIIDWIKKSVHALSCSEHECENDIHAPSIDINLKQSKVKKSKVKKSKEKAEESKVNAPACEPADALSSDGEQVSCDIPESLPAQELDYTQYSSYVIDDENGEPVPYIPSGEPAVMQEDAQIAEDAPVYGVDIPFPEPPPEEDSCGYAPDLTQEEYDPDAYDFSLEELAQRSPVGAAGARMLSHCNIITEDGRSIPVTEYQPDRKGKPAAPLPSPLPVQKSSDGVEHKPDEALMASLTRTAMQGGTIDVSSEIAKICAEGARNSALFEQKYGSHEEYQRQMDEKVLASAEVTVIKVPKPQPPEELPPQHKALAQRYGENNVQQYLVRYRQWCERNGRPADDPYPAIERWMAKDLCR